MISEIYPKSAIRDRSTPKTVGFVTFFCQDILRELILSYSTENDPCGLEKPFIC